MKARERSTYDLRQPLRHVGARMEIDFDQRNVLNRLRFDVVDAGDVQEVVLVVIREIPLHLCWIHAAIRLRDDDHRQIQVGEDVDRHTPYGKRGEQRQRGSRHEDRDRTTKRLMDEPHGEVL
jgi:hypothetical protein